MFSGVFAGLVLGAFNGSAAAQTFPHNHVHLNVPDPAAAANWYEKYFGARRLAEGPDRLMFGTSWFIFTKKADAKPQHAVVQRFADRIMQSPALELRPVEIASSAEDSL